MPHTIKKHLQIIPLRQRKKIADAKGKGKATDGHKS